MVVSLVLPLKRPRDDAGGILRRWRSKRIKTTLPTLAELAEVVDRPLSDDEKIPVPADRLEELVSPSFETRDICTSDDVRLVFCAGHGNNILDTLFFTAVQTPPSGGTENSFISFWDRNIRDILEFLVPEGKSTRNSSMNTATRSLRPDYAFLLNKLCQFRGEEKAPESTEDPKEELATKLAWVYSPAPYVLGSVVKVELV